MNKKYITVPAILSAICVCSAAVIGLTHYFTDSYAKAHQTDETPNEIKALYPDSSVRFVKEKDFEPVSAVGDFTKVTLADAYRVQRSNKDVGYAYLVDAGKPVKTEVLFTVSFEGTVSESSLSSFRPAAIYVYQGGDAGYDKNVITYAEYLVNGSAALDGTSDFIVGGTKSQKYLLDGVKAARNDYLSRYKAILRSLEKGGLH